MNRPLTVRMQDKRALTAIGGMKPPLSNLNNSIQVINDNYLNPSNISTTVPRANTSHSLNYNPRLNKSVVNDQ